MLNDFKKLMIARFLFTLAVQVQAVVIGWRIYEVTQDPLSLGLIGLTEAIPAIGLALYAGYVVDHSRPLVVYRRVLEGSLLSGAVLFFSQLSIFELSSFGHIAALYVSSLITGTARSFSQPAIFTAVPRIIQREDIHRASAWMSSAMQTARIAGPALGGILFGWLGLAISAGTVCSLLILAIGFLVWMKEPLSAPDRPGKETKLAQELLSGLRFVLKHPILFPALTLDMISVLFGGVTALLPIFASEILYIGPKGLGALRAAPALGAALMSFILVRIEIRQNAGKYLLTAVTGFGVCILIFGMSKSLVLSLTVLGLSGAFDSISMVVRASAVQLASPDSMRGRISAVNSIFIGSSNEIGEFESGVVAKLFGTVPAVIFGGTMCLFTVVTLAKLYPTLRTLNLKTLKSGA